MISDWIQVVGRFHPLLVHLPIGLLAGLAALEIAATTRRSAISRQSVSILGWLAAGTAAIAATTGWVLGGEEGYGGSTLANHRLLGIAIAACSVTLAVLHSASRRGERPIALNAYRAALAAALVLLFPAGHLGSVLTRGDGFLTAPLDARNSAAGEAAPASSYAKVIAPLLAARCSACHGKAKRKGGLSLVDPDGIVAGGIDGPVLVPGSPDESELLRRLRLPEDQKDHMPPRGKAQPTSEEVRLIERWIAAGAAFEGTVPGLVPERAVPPASPAAIAALERALVHVEPIAQGSSLLWIDFAAAAAQTGDAEAMALLEPVVVQIADLSLGRCEFTDATLGLVARMSHLRRLDLRETSVTDAGIAALARHASLEQLSLVRTRLTDAAVDSLSTLPAIRRLHLWRSGVGAEALARLRETRPTVAIDAGDAPDGSALETEPEIRLTSAAPVPGAPSGTDPLLPINAACPVSGSAVDPAFRVVFRGRVVGFCCAKCPAQFWAEPEKYASKLP